MGRFRRLSDFGNFLDRLLVAWELTVSSFARLVGVHPGVVSNCKVQSLIPDRIPVWADALKLRGEEREEFVRLAWLAHSPPYVRDLVKRLQEQNQAYETELNSRRRR